VDERGCTYCWDTTEDGNFLAYFFLLCIIHCD
jgi:hypothetical protein